MIGNLLSIEILEADISCGKELMFTRFWTITELTICANKNKYFISYVRLISKCGKNMRVLNVAEKNDAAKNIAAFLSGGRATKREGLSKFNKIYEFECEVFGENVKMIMTSVAGHLLTYEFTGLFRSWKSSSPVSLFEAPIEKICPPDNENIKKTLEREIRSCSKLIIWTDCDREGEGIGFEVIDVCRAVKPNIHILRAKFSEITHSSVHRALKNLENPNKHISDAVDVRQELDLRIGAAFTRFQTLHLKKAFPSALSENLVSYGSCQFPTLGFVVERFKAVSEFIPEKFWQINVKHKINELSVDFHWKRNRLFNELACEVLYEKCKETGIATVENIQSKPKTKWRPRPLDTVELEKLASKKLKISAKEALKIAEKLYTQGLISYPRTETNIFPENLELKPLVECQAVDPSWGEFAKKILENGPNPFQGNKSDQAHPPIHPIKYSNGLTGNEQKIYNFIVRHFLACLSKHAEGLETTVDIDINSEKFAGKGLMITARNYLEVYPYDKWTDKEIHVYREGEKFLPEISLGEGETSAPELLTEADLIALMEKHGIGTDATHAEHIETIKARLYVGLQKDKYFVPRTLGMGLVEGYINMGFNMARPELRAELEADLKRISENKKSPREVLARHIKSYKQIFEAVQKQTQRLSETIENFLQIKASPVIPDRVFENDLQIVGKCPSCNSALLLRNKKDEGKYVGCSAFPRCRVAYWFPSFVENVSPTNEKCSRCGPDYHLLKFKFRANSCYLPSDHVVCIWGCDPNILELLSINKKTNPNVKNLNTIDARLIPNWQTPANEVDDSGFSSFNENSFKGLLPEKSSTPNCYCGLPCVRLAVKKSGPNFGKIFFKCNASQGSPKCDFFLWEGEERNPERTNSNGLGRTISENRLDESQIRCFCAVPCRRLTVIKEGPNKGKEFYCCGKPTAESDKCNFFKWAEDEGKAFCGSDKDSERPFSGRARGLFDPKNKNSSKKRKCGICGQEGHNRKNCTRR